MGGTDPYKLKISMRKGSLSTGSGEKGPWRRQSRKLGMADKTGKSQTPILTAVSLDFIQETKEKCPTPP